MPLSRPLHESVVVITGASSGIGAATALALARRGSRLVLAARREGALAQVAARCADLGARAVPVPTDMSDPTAVTALADRAVAEFGRIDAWVNNASVGVYAPLHEAPLDEVRRVIDVNLFGYLYGAQAAIARMSEGVLVNVGSLLGLVTTPYMGPYNVSKHAIQALSGTLRQDLRATGVTGISVSTVLPASIDTPFYAAAANRTGRTPGPLPPAYFPSTVAKVIVRTLEHPRHNAYAGRLGALLAAQRAVAPGFTELMLGLYGRVGLRREPAPSTNGALFTPADQPAALTGGWSRVPAGVVTTVASAGLVGAGLVGGAFAVNRLRRRGRL